MATRGKVGALAATAVIAASVSLSSCRTDQLIIVHDSLATEANRLALLKRQHGLRVKVVRTGQIGSPRTAARITERVWKVHRWSLGSLRSVLLVGDAELIPPHYRSDPESSDGVHATDLYYGARSDVSYLPLLAVGRLPASTPAEARTLVDKTVSYRPAPDKGLLFGFDPELTHAPEDSAALQANGVAVDIGTFVTPYNCDDAQAADVIGRINDGRLLTAYYGHGTLQAMGQLCSRHLDGLSNVILPVMLSGGCYNGQFDVRGPAGEESIAEDLLSRPSGAVAVVASTRTGGYGYAYKYLDGFLAQTSRSVTLGEMHRAGLRSAYEAAVAAGSSVGEGSFTKNFVEKMTLFGDPELLLRPKLAATGALVVETRPPASPPRRGRMPPPEARCPYERQR